MTTNDTMSIKKNSMTRRKFWMNFTSYTWISCTKLKTWWIFLTFISFLFMQTWMFKERNNVMNMLLRAYQDWLKLVNDLVEIWSRSDSGLTQIWLNTLFLSQHSFLSPTSCSSTSSSFRVTNTFLLSLAQSLNIT